MSTIHYGSKIVILAMYFKKKHPIFCIFLGRTGLPICTCLSTRLQVQVSLFKNNINAPPIGPMLYWFYQRLNLFILQWHLFRYGNKFEKNKKKQVPDSVVHNNHISIVDIDIDFEIFFWKHYLF